MELSKINPSAIKAGLAVKASSGAPKGVAFGDVMGGMSAMGPATGELVGQWTGGSNLASAILHSAFSAVDVTSQMSTGNTMTQGSMMTGGYGAYSDIPGVFGVGRYGTQAGYMSGAKATADSGMFGGTGMKGAADDPSMYTTDIMQAMNSNNLKLLELQALMQSNMQSWTTKSNILSADHRARMSMIEKFSARG